MVNIYESNFDDSFDAAKDLLSIVNKFKQKDEDTMKPKKKLKTEKKAQVNTLNEDYSVLTDALIS